MQKIKVDWAKAAQISTCYTYIATRITLIAIFFIVALAAIALKLLHIPITKELVFHFFKQYRPFILLGIATFHFIPSNLYAIIQVFQYRFAEFTIAAIPHSETKKTQ